MSDPRDVAQQLIAAFQGVESAVRALITQAADGTISARDLISGLRDHMRDLDIHTRNWVSQQLPGVWQAGAIATGLPFAWNAPTSEAVTALAHQNYADLLANTTHVDEHTRRALQSLAHAGALSTVAGGGTANQAGLNVTDAMQRQAGNVLTVTYRNGARHSLADWADTAVRTQSALAYNHGALSQFKAWDVKWIEIADGPLCGLTYHEDPELANGLVVPVETAEEYPLSHPRCARTLIPRPDITSDSDASDWNDARDMTEMQQQADAERERAATSTVTGRRFTVAAETRRVAREQRASRIPRTPASR